MRFVLAFVYAVGSIVCHQIPERSFHVAGIQFPVCARCTGLYVGGAIAIAVWIGLRKHIISFRAARLALAIAGAPTIVSLTTAELGWWDPANPARAVLAAPLGAAAGVIVTAGLTRNLR